LQTETRDKDDVATALKDCADLAPGSAAPSGGAASALPSPRGSTASADNATPAAARTPAANRFGGVGLPGMMPLPGMGASPRGASGDAAGEAATPSSAGGGGGGGGDDFARPSRPGRGGARLPGMGMALPGLVSPAPAAAPEGSS
jgi:hypothetical protein